MEDNNIFDLGLEENNNVDFGLEEITKELGIEDEKINESMQEIAKLLSLPDEQFNVLAPYVLESYMSMLNSPEIRFGVLADLDLKPQEQYELNNTTKEIFELLDKDDTLSDPKKAFVKQFMNGFINCFNATTGLTSRVVKISYEKCNENAKEPAYAHVSDSGMDVFALEDITINPGETKMIPIGIKIALPPGYELQVRPKSGVSLRTKLRISNAPGTIDAGYRDEIGILVDNIEAPIKSAAISESGELVCEYGAAYTIGKGQKFAQLVLQEVPKASMSEVENIFEVENIDANRNGGFGSTGLE